MKDSYYFPHDYHARHDPKLEKIRMTMGCEGIGIFWCLVEMLYEENGYLSFSDLEVYAKSLNAEHDQILKVIEGYGLFQIQDGKFYSETLLQRLEHLTIKKQKARESAGHRWNANAMRTHSEGNAIKNSIVKDSKGKKINKNHEKPGFLSEIEKAKPIVLKEIAKKNNVAPNSESALYRLEELTKEVAAAKDVKNPVGLLRHKARNQ